MYDLKIRINVIPRTEQATRLVPPTGCTVEFLENLG
jgi:hypothetical protein